MTAPTIVRRRLTINFDRSVRGGKPQVMEVVVVPLSTPSSPNGDVTLVGGPQSRDVLLGDAINSVVFDLVPSGSPDLTATLPYRVAWREKYMGTQFTQDFIMPDFDVDFDDLGDLGNIVGGETYLQWTDLAKPSGVIAIGVAAVNEDGQVIDAAGNPVTGDAASSTVQTNLDDEAILRQQGDVSLQSHIDALASRTTTIESVAAADALNLSTSKDALNNRILIEETARHNADVAHTAAITALETTTGTDITAINDLLQDDVNGKADLVGGKVPSDQLPSLAVGNAVPAANQAAMLALTPTQVQQGDLCVRPDGTWMLTGTDPSQLSSWTKLTDAGTVSSVNGQTGAVVLNAASVGARSVSTPIPLDDITGLQAALNTKANVTSTVALANRVTAIEDSTTIVKTVGGVIPHQQHGNDVAFLSTSNQLVNKDGVPVSPSGTGTLAIGDVTGLQSALNSKLAANSPAVTNARTPTSHAASHQAGGSDPISLAPADITGLAAIISNNGLSSSSNHGNRINALEAGTSGGGGGSGSPAKSAWYDSPSIIGPTSALSAFNAVVQKSPFGKTTGGLFYYNPAGAAEGESLFPYVTPGGHLKLVQRNEANAPDPVMATQAALDTLTTTVTGKADQASLASTNATVATKAAQSSLDTTNANVTLKASTAALNTLSDTVALKADQTALTATNANVALKANQADLTTTNNLALSKASQSALDTTNAGLAVKADKTGPGGTVPEAQIPALPIAKITGLDTALTAKANLIGGIVPLSELPDYGISKVTSLTATLAAKADLVGGLVPTSQLPALAYTTTVVVGTQTEMLTLTSAQVQPGDVCVITGTSAQGSYILSAPDTTVLSNWTKLIAPSGTVATVNGQSGTVVLAPGDIGAAVAGTNAIPQTYVSGLSTSLAAKADTVTVNTALGLKANSADVAGAQVSENKQQVAAVALSHVVTNNVQPIDGLNPPSGSVVLLAGQTNPVDRGIYVVNGSGAWSRSSTDMPDGQYFLKGTMVTCSGGNTNKDTFWQQTSASGLVGTASQTWAKVMTAGVAPVYTGSLGVEKTGNDFHAKVESGGGIMATSTGLKLDPTYAVRKYAAYLPVGVNPVTITHGLGTPDVMASFRGGSSGDAVLVGWRVVDSNNISAEFDTAPSSGTQWRVTICG